MVFGKLHNRHFKTLAIIEEKDYYFNEYEVTLISSNIQDWFSENDIEEIMDCRIKMQDKYKVALAIEKKGLDMIIEKINNMPNKYNNILQKVDFYKEYKAFKHKYCILIWTSTYWSDNNFAVKCIQDTLKELRPKNIAYQQIIIGETDPTFIKISQFIENDKNVDIFKIFQKIEIKNLGGILV